MIGREVPKSLRTFLWYMEQYFSMAKISLDEQVNIAVMYLIRDAKLGWQTMSKKDLNARKPKVNT